MKLYRYTSNGSGVMSGDAIEELSTLVTDDKNCDFNSYFKQYIPLMESLHSPTMTEFIDNKRPPVEALFYFTEDGIKNQSLLIAEIYNIYKGYNIKVEETIINLEKYNQYTVWYQDEDQMCIILGDKK